MEDFELAKYIYWEYTVAVLLLTEVIRAITKGLQSKIIRFVTVDNPKWLSLIVASLLAFLDWIVFSRGNTFHFWQFVISFGVAVLGYDYAFKLVKDMFKKTAHTEPEKINTFTESGHGFSEGGPSK